VQHVGEPDEPVVFNFHERRHEASRADPQDEVLIVEQRQPVGMLFQVRGLEPDRDTDVTPVGELRSFPQLEVVRERRRDRRPTA